MADIVFSESSGLQDSIYGKCLYPLRMVIKKNAEAFEQTSMLDKLFNMEKSDKFAEQITGLTSMRGPLPVGEGGDYVTDGFQEGYSSVFQHVTWKDQFEVTEEMIEDNRILDMRSAPIGFATGWGRTREEFGAHLFGEAVRATTGKFTFNGFTFSTKTADGKNLFATDHPSKTGRGAAQSNRFNDDFSENALAAAEAAMQGFTDDNGHIQAVAPDTIVIGSADWDLKKTIFATIGADKSPTTANNGANFLFGRWNVIIWPYLDAFVGSGTHPWILLDSRYNKTSMGAVWFDRKAMTVKQKIADNDNLLTKGKGRWSAGFHDWRFACVGGLGSGGTDLISA